MLLSLFFPTCLLPFRQIYFLRSRQARWTEGFTLVFMVSKKLLPLFIFHIAPRVMNNSGYMFCLVFQEGPFCFKEGPLLFSSSFLHYLGCFLQSSPCHEQFWMLFSIEDIPYRGYFTYLKKRAYIWPLILFYFVARLFCQHIHLVMCTGGGHFAFLSSQAQDWIGASSFSPRMTWWLYA